MAILNDITPLLALVPFPIEHKYPKGRKFIRSYHHLSAHLEVSIDRDLLKDVWVSVQAFNNVSLILTYLIFITIVFCSTRDTKKYLLLAHNKNLL